MQIARVRVIFFIVLLAVMSPLSARAQSTPPTVLPLWDTQIGASFVGTSGNSATSSLGVDFSAHRRGPVWEFESTGNAIKLRTDDTTTAERYLAQGRAKRELTPIVQLTSGVKVEHDEFAGVEFRSVLDGGLAWHLVRSDAVKLDAVTALAWDHENPVIGGDVDEAGGVLELQARVPFSASAEGNGRVTFYPDLKTTDASRLEAEANAQASMNAHLALKFSYLLRYANAPLPGFKKTDNTMSASVVLHWKASTPAPR